MASLYDTKSAGKLKGASGVANNLWGDEGDDYIVGGYLDDMLAGNGGDDYIRGNKGNDTVYGDAGDDVLRGEAGNDSIYGGEGNDAISGGAGDDVIGGGEGDDFATGGSGNDMIWGEAGDDVLLGGSGEDQLWGESGNDVLTGGAGNDRLYGGDGNDILNGGSNHDILFGDAGDDIINGGSGDDDMAGGEGNDTITGGQGNDYVFASSGNDRYNGNSGFDTVDFSGMNGPVVVDLARGVAQVDGFSHVVKGFEQVLGTASDDRMTGDTHHNTLNGYDGDDWFRSGGSDDLIRGGDGADTFAYFRADVADGTSDRISDFELGVDRLEFGDFYQPDTDLAQVVRAVDQGNGTMIQAMVGGNYVNVALLENVSVDKSQIYDLFA